MSITRLSLLIVFFFMHWTLFLLYRSTQRELSFESLYMQQISRWEYRSEYARLWDSNKLSWNLSNITKFYFFLKLHIYRKSAEGLHLSQPLWVLWQWSMNYLEHFQRDRNLWRVSHEQLCVLTWKYNMPLVFTTHWPELVIQGMPCLLLITKGQENADPT